MRSKIAVLVTFGLATVGCRPETTALEASFGNPVPGIHAEVTAAHDVRSGPYRIQFKSPGEAFGRYSIHRGVASFNVALPYRLSGPRANSPKTCAIRTFHLEVGSNSSSGWASAACDAERPGFSVDAPEAWRAKKVTFRGQVLELDRHLYTVHLTGIEMSRGDSGQWLFRSGREQTLSVAPGLKVRIDRRPEFGQALPLSIVYHPRQIFSGTPANDLIVGDVETSIGTVASMSGNSGEERGETDLIIVNAPADRDPAAEFDLHFSVRKVVRSYPFSLPIIFDWRKP